MYKMGAVTAPIFLWIGSEYSGCFAAVFFVYLTQ